MTKLHLLAPRPTDLTVMCPIFNEDGKDTDYIDTGINIKIKPLSTYNQLTKVMEILEPLGELSGESLTKFATQSNIILNEIFKDLIESINFHGHTIEFSSSDLIKIFERYPFLANYVGKFVQNEANFYPRLDNPSDYTPPVVKGRMNVLLPYNKDGLVDHYFSPAYIDFDVDLMFTSEFERELFIAKTPTQLASLLSKYVIGWDEDFFGEPVSQESFTNILSSYDNKSLLDQTIQMLFRDRESTNEMVIKAANYSYNVTKFLTPDDLGETFEERELIKIKTLERMRSNKVEEKQKSFDAIKDSIEDTKGIEKYISLYNSVVPFQNIAGQGSKPTPINPQTIFHHFNYMGRDLKPSEYQAIISMDSARCRAIGELIDEINERRAIEAEQKSKAKQPPTKRGRG